MLKFELGEDVFKAGMEAYISTHGYSAATLADYFEVMEAISGVDLETFQNQWINGTGHPTFEIETHQTEIEDGKWKTEITLQQDEEKPFLMKMPLRVTRADNGEEAFVEEIVIEEATTQVERILEFPIRRSHFDRTRVYLSRNTAKNGADPNLSGVADGSDLIDLAAMQHRNIVFSYGNQNYFYPNGNYNPSYDLDSNGIIDEADIAIFLDTDEEPASVETPDESSSD